MTTTADSAVETPMPPVRVHSAARRKLSGIARTKNLEKKAKRAAEFADDVAGHAQQLRTTRDQAATALRRHFGWSPVDCYRLIGVPRVLFAKIDARNSQRGIDAPYLISEPVTRELALNASLLLPEWDELADEARLVRDTAILDLVVAGYRNVEISHLTGLTEARIAQVKFPPEATPAQPTA